MSSIRKRLRPRLLVVYAIAVGLIWAARPTLVAFALGLLPIAAGVTLRIWATGHLFKNDALTTTGPYAYLRNPLYLGTLLIATGFALMARSPLAWGLYALFILGFFAYYMPYKDRIEGARLEALYGDAFRRYSSAVPSLLPRIPAYRPLPADRAPEAAWRRARFSDNNELGTALAVSVGVAAMAARWALL